ncbi:DNA polymerase III subunit beta [Hymenobacter metallilatus]|uniref:Beta sliding clamp n=1 Tax=Hymenobacter metallilatus TaxID=2493666 RepID=A0A428JCN0_9BACT|nr:DNA polymerase III subunit beta [Hymenobacter metallilatus]RSK29875.1 DNA polymerase III subunit beta [Hymenobacter metallilatus]
MPAISINSSALLAAVKLLMPLVPNNPVVPILKNLRLLAVGNTLQLAASNLEADLATETDLSDATADFDICLPAKLLLTTLQNLPSQAITLHLDSDTYAVTLRAGKGRYRLPGENSVSWPNPTADKPLVHLHVAGATLSHVLKNTAPFAVNDATRQSMMSVLLDIRNQDIRAVATDSHRLSFIELNRNLVQVEGPERQFILPVAPARLLATLTEKTGPVTLQLGEWLQVRGVGWQLRCRLVDERYPAYENVIPLNQPYTLQVDKQQLMGCIRRVLAYAAEKTQQIGLRMSDNGTLRIWSESIEVGTEAVEEMESSYNGEDFEMGFNGKYLLEALQVMPEGSVDFQLSTPNRAAIMVPSAPEPEQPRQSMLLMPVLLSSMAPAA